MTTPPSETQQRTPLGDLLEHARVNVLQITGREAARRAGISETRWRQVVMGWQAGRGGAKIPATPKVRTVVAMARAVDVDVRTALDAAGLTVSDEGLAVLLKETEQAGVPNIVAQPDGGIDLQYEFERIARLNIPAKTKLALTKGIIDLYEQAQAEE